MEKILSIIPVASYELFDVLKKSVNNLKKLRAPDNTQLNFVYVIDSKEEDDERVEFIKQLKGNFDVIKRNKSYEKRGGAIERALKEKESDLVALFDIDSKPDPDFLEKALEAFDKEKHFIASARRYITNKNYNLVTEMVSYEYEFFTDLIKLSSKLKSFFHFNGQIGLLDYNYIKKKGFRHKICEDGDFAVRAYLDGKSPKIVEGTRIGEMSPLCLSDLYKQRIRWNTGNIELLESFKRVMGDQLDWRVKTGYMLTIVLPFISPLFIPFFVPYCLTKGLKNEVSYRSILFSIFSAFFMSFTAISALSKKMTTEVEWNKIHKKEEALS